MGATTCPPTCERKMRARGAQVGPAKPLGRPTPPGRDSPPNFVFESPQMATFHFHTCRATEWKFSPGFSFKMILSSSFLPHLHLDLLALIPSTTLSFLLGRQGDRSVQCSLIHVRSRGRTLAGKSCPCNHGGQPGGRARRQDTIGDHPYAGVEGGAEGHQRRVG